MESFFHFFLMSVFDLKEREKTKELFIQRPPLHEAQSPADYVSMEFSIRYNFYLYLNKS